MFGVPEHFAAAIPSPVWSSLLFLLLEEYPQVSFGLLCLNLLPHTPFAGGESVLGLKRSGLTLCWQRPPSPLMPHTLPRAPGELIPPMADSSAGSPFRLWLLTSSKVGKIPQDRPTCSFACLGTNQNFTPERNRYAFFIKSPPPSLCRKEGRQALAAKRPAA